MNLQTVLRKIFSIDGLDKLIESTTLVLVINFPMVAEKANSNMK
jgi:hypothetical protein